VLEFDGYLDSVQGDAARLIEIAGFADPGAKVPSCPEWTVADLLVHTGQVHRWVHRILTTRAQARVPWAEIPHREPAGEGLAAWFAEGAGLVVAALRDAGPDAVAWGWAGEDTGAWWARRMAQETLVHRLDGELAIGQLTAVLPELAVDNIDELLHNALSPVARAYPRRGLLADAAPLHLHATDVTGGEWTLYGDGERWLRWETGHAKGEAAVRGTAQQLLLWLNKRLPEGDPGPEVFGDAAVAALWREGLTLD
jgi:uncharacterized protein (TIGR03083 family)